MGLSLSGRPTLRERQVGSYKVRAHAHTHIYTRAMQCSHVASAAKGQGFGAPASAARRVEPHGHVRMGLMRACAWVVFASVFITQKPSNAC